MQIDIKKVIRERGDIAKAVRHNLKAVCKQREMILPEYIDATEWEINKYKKTL